MIEISLTRFVDFVIKAGSPKYTSLKETKQQLQDGYDPATDYYRQIREVIIDHHRRGKPLSSIDHLVTTITNQSKQANYPAIADGYKKFRGKKQMAWFAPPTGLWTHGPVTVALNPEMGLDFGGRRHVIKLYFKSEPPRKLEVKAILALMDQQLQGPQHSHTMGILDVRRGKLITDIPTDPALVTLLKGEAAALATIWPSL